MPKLVGVAFLAFPVLLAMIMLIVWRLHRRVSRAVATVPAGWLTTQALVVDEQSRYEPSHRPDPGHGMVFVRTPIVRFTDPRGQAVTARSRIEGTFMPRPGAVITVHYDPANPQSVRVAAQSLPRANRVGPVVVGTLGVLIFLPLAALSEFFGYVILTA